VCESAGGTDSSGAGAPGRFRGEADQAHPFFFGPSVPVDASDRGRRHGTLSGGSGVPGCGYRSIVTLSSTRVRPIVVASVPASHVYVRHIAAEHADGVTRLEDPDPDVPERSAEQVWWPPVMLRPEWVVDHDFDVFHIQFGFDAWRPKDLLRLVQTLRDRGRPLVYTVHDLRNPHHPDRRVHDAQLDVLVPYADGVITLTDGAAREIRRRWGRAAVVVPHPHVVDLSRPRRAAGFPPSGPFRVGLHVKSLRPSMDPLRLLPDLVRVVQDLPNAVLQVNGHRDVLSHHGDRRDRELASFLERGARRGDLELHVHDFLPDDDLWSYLESLHVSVLPYRFGTHSGWLEACRDLGTAVVAPTCGYYADQGPVFSYVHDEDEYDGATLQAAVRNAWAAAATAPLAVEVRRAQRARIARAHRDLYSSVLG
jgi:glycosyltransferase involved in cell wall biosynthesis